MKSFLISDDDIVFGADHGIIMTDGADEELQAVERLLTTDTGEWFLNAEHGLAYEKIRGKNITDGDIQMALLRALAQEGRVKEVVSIEISRDTPHRTVQISAVCRMTSGNTVTWKNGGISIA